MFPEHLRAATLTQPWAGLVASGIKPIENRDRNIAGPDLFGKRVAIHASREIDEDVYARIIDIDGDAYRATYLDRSDGMLVAAIDTSSRWYKLSRITSAIIGVATLAAKIVGDDPDTLHAAREHLGALAGTGALKWYFGPIGYILTDIIALPEPVPCKGALGFWRVPHDKRDAIYAQLRSAA